MITLQSSMEIKVDITPSKDTKEGPKLTLEKHNDHNCKYITIIYDL